MNVSAATRHARARREGQTVYREIVSADGGARDVQVSGKGVRGCSFWFFEASNFSHRRGLEKVRRLLYPSTIALNKLAIENHFPRLTVSGLRKEFLDWKAW